jgi:transcriptional regulator with XRE-family HTH domain
MSRTSKKERERWLLAVGQAVRDFRTRLDVSQEELGYRAGFHRTYVSDLERGQRNPTAWTLKQLTETLGTTASEVLARAEEILGSG